MAFSFGNNEEEQQPTHREEFEFGLSPEEFRNYFLHVLGINLLSVWLSDRAEYTKVNDKRREIEVNLFASKGLFLFNPSAKERFYAIGGERDFCDWLTRINWSRIVLNPFDRTLSFVSKRVDGDKRKLPDMPVFAITFHFDQLKKLKPLRDEKFLNIKEIYFDDGVIVLSKPKVKKLPFVVLKSAEEAANPFTRDELAPVTTADDIKRGIIQRKNSVFSSVFKGNAAPVSSQFAGLLKPFNEREMAEQLKSVGGLNSSEYLREFATKTYDYGDWYEQNVAANEEDRHKNNAKFSAMWD